MVVALLNLLPTHQLVRAFAAHAANGYNLVSPRRVALAALVFHDCVFAYAHCLCEVLLRHIQRRAGGSKICRENLFVETHSLFTPLKVEEICLTLYEV